MVKIQPILISNSLELEKAIKENGKAMVIANPNLIESIKKEISKFENKNAKRKKRKIWARISSVAMIATGFVFPPAAAVGLATLSVSTVDGIHHKISNLGEKLRNYQWSETSLENAIVLLKTKEKNFFDPEVDELDLTHIQSDISEKRKEKQQDFCGTVLFSTYFREHLFTITSDKKITKRYIHFYVDYIEQCYTDSPISEKKPIVFHYLLHEVKISLNLSNKKLILSFDNDVIEYKDLIKIKDYSGIN